MPSNSGYRQSSNSMSQNKSPSPSMPQRRSMMNYDMHNNSSNMPFNNSPSYGQNQQDMSRDEQLYVKEIFVGGLWEDINEDDLYKLFLPFGNIAEVRIIRTHDGRSRGFGFVEFEDYAAANNAVKVLHSINYRQINVEKAIPREQMQKQSAANSQMNNHKSNYNYLPTSSSCFNTTMSFNNNPNQISNSIYMQPAQPYYQQRQQQGFWNNPSNIPPSSSGSGRYSYINMPRQSCGGGGSYQIVINNFFFD